jgi:membrane protein
MTRWRKLSADFSTPQWWHNTAGFALFLWRRFREDDCPRSAAALTFLSLFAVVPLMTVIYAMLSAIPVFAQIGTQVEDFIFQHFVPASGQEIQSYLQQFSAQARNLTGIGIVFLVVTALTLMTEIEKTLNAIWRVRRARSGLASFLLYWAVLSLGPLLIGVAFIISTYLLSLRALADGVDLIGMHTALLSAIPFLLTAAALTLAFAAVPNCRVRLRDALIAGLLAALVFELCKLLFARVVANASYQFIYGAFATIPLFLLWIYLCWVIVLAGAELSHALSSYDGRRTRQLPDLLLALALLELFWQRHQRGETVRERELLRRRWLLGRHRLAGERWTSLGARLLDAGLLRRDEQGNYLLGRDLHHYTLWQLCELLRHCPAPMGEVPQPLPAWFERCRQLLNSVADHDRMQLAQPLAELFTLPDTVDPDTTAGEPRAD